MYLNFLYLVNNVSFNKNHQVLFTLKIKLKTNNLVKGSRGGFLTGGEGLIMGVDTLSNSYKRQTLNLGTVHERTSVSLTCKNFIIFKR